MRWKHFGLGSLLMLSVGCGGSLAAGGAAKSLAKEDQSGQKDQKGVMVSKEAASAFNLAIDSFVEHDKKQDWNKTTCGAVADQFKGASSEQKSATNRHLVEALYNAGLAYQRCGNHEEAKAMFKQSLEADGSFHRASAQLALYDYQQSGNLDAAVSRLDEIIRAAKFQNVEALVSLAALQMQRGSDQPSGDAKNDLEAAQKNLQRALAIDDSYMPAFNQLAIYYFEQAKAKAGASGPKRGKRRRGLVVASAAKAQVNEQQLDLAALVASQAQRKNPNYAPIHNTTGLIMVELKNFNGAVKAFGRAKQLDPNFFEAHMNYAAVNLSFRGFQEAERSYRQALKLRPNEYEAHLGLALAIRGQISLTNREKLIAAAQKSLDKCKQLAPDRAETYYNEAILTQEFRAKGGSNAIPMLEKAAQQYQAFVAKAGGDPAFADAVKRSKERTQDIHDTVKFIKEGDQARKDQEEINRQNKAMEKQLAKEDKEKANQPKAAPKKP